ncbi:winged helix-turn-helix domain-containing protein [Janibacter melonis]|uniref:winged helix-turn-helix domain-containing protein n=1 Tax=Janibacter melonis TaxID=262209 RepID=UPI001E384951|nr:helix-turn-helix domain-containing protein [Janibacter melonis]MCB5991030.1 helix-turn-helix domain-containing protein [Janibacter melonis]
MSTPGTPDGWRLLAHPLRTRILAHLRLHGGSTSAELARALGTNSGATSYHLRTLAEGGLVEDTGLGNAKTRVWALPDEDDDDVVVTRVGTDDDDPLSAQDEAWLAHDHVEHLAARAHAWVDAAPTWPLVWQEEAGLHDQAVLVDEEQLVALRTEIMRTLERYRRIGAGTPGAKRVAVTLAVHPVDRTPRS